MAPIEKEGTGTRKLLLFVGGFAALILAVTILARVVGPSPVESPPPRLDPVAADAPAEAARPPPEPPPSASAEPIAVPAPPAALPPEPQPPPKRLFADECAEQIYRVTNPSHRAFTATDRGPEKPKPTDLQRLARAHAACQCIEHIYGRVGVKGLSGEDARGTYEEVLKRHGYSRGVRPLMRSMFEDCEHRAQ